MVPEVLLLCLSEYAEEVISSFNCLRFLKRDFTLSDALALVAQQLLASNMSSDVTCSTVLTAVTSDQTPDITNMKLQIGI